MQSGLIDPGECEIYTTLRSFPSPAVALQASDGDNGPAILTPSRAREIAETLTRFADRVDLALANERRASDVTYAEQDDAGQLALGVPGEQRAIPTLARGSDGD
jgi:hypothetical protein